jgi:hypothetical protein
MILPPPWDLFDIAVSESQKVKLLVRIKEGTRIIVILSVFDPVYKNEVKVLQFSQIKDYKELIWHSNLIYSGPQG